MNSVKKSFGVILVLFICIFCVQVCFAEEYEYDKLNRVTKITYEDGSYVEYTYDANGNITKVNTVNVKDKSDSSDDTSSDNNESGDNSNNDSSSDESNSNASDGANSDNSSSNSSSDKDNSSNNSGSNVSDNNSSLDDNLKEDSNTSNDGNSSGDDLKSDTNVSKDDNKKGNSSSNTSNSNNNSGNNTSLLNNILDKIINDEKNEYVMIESVVPTKDKPDKESVKEYFEEWLIVYPLTFEELMEKYSGLYKSVVANSPLDKHSWLEYVYTLYYKDKDYVLAGESFDKSNEDDKLYIKIIDYFMVNEFYREYIKFKEKIYGLSSYYGEVNEFIALEIKE